MPEAVEVKQYSDLINKFVSGEVLNSIHILGGRYIKQQPKGWKEFDKTLPLKLISTYTKGKFMYMRFEKDYIMFCTLGLSGGWVFEDTNASKEYFKQASEHLNIRFKFDNGNLYFFDQLSFGTLNFTTNSKDLEKKLNSLGSDILDSQTTKKIFVDAIKSHPDKKIGLAVVDQKIISGVGNYLRADALWVAQISPHRFIRTLKSVELNRLYRALRGLVWGEYDYKYAIKNQIIKKSVMLPSKYQRTFFVYDQETDIWGNKVISEPLYTGTQKRTIYWVKQIQK